MTPEILEISFKGNKRVHYFNPKEIKVKPGDPVIVEADKGVDLGTVTKVGRLVALSEIKGEPKNIIRKAAETDLEQLKNNRDLEKSAFLVSREKIKKHKLNMKLVDVEYQYDKNKLTFYFTSERRVDFRELVKDLAAEYRTRIELRQIGVRDESRRLGGLGVCGKPLCCSCHITDFAPITTQYAKEQNMPLNPCKLTGICSRLKCCLLHEKPFYDQAMERFPALDTVIKTKHGQAVVAKTDIFKDLVYLRYANKEELQEISLKAYNKLKRTKCENKK